ncbi:MAG: HAD-IIA family hydrolase [Fimbriimonadales bacterium]|nr:HAD-IIA family hydrolase [Fimbriimonadales bacterium]
MRRYPLYVFDLDGTLYRGDEPIPHAAETVRRLAAEGSAVRYFTNNSGQTREFFTRKLLSMGFPCEPHMVHSTATGLAALCRERGVDRVFCVGEPGLVRTLRESGVEVANADRRHRVWPLGEADTVVVGICRTFSYALLDAALQCLLRGARFWATNTDATYPLEEGRLEPGAGSLVAAVATCAGRQPDLVVGKPSPLIVGQILREAGVPPEDALLVGDRPETDLECGRTLGCPTCLVLTGVTSHPPEGQPFCEDLRGLLAKG